jgi:hypothetical protein
LSARALVVLSNIFPLPKAEQRGLPFVPSSRLIHCQSIDLQAQRQSPSKLFFQFSVATSDRWARCIYKPISIAIYLAQRSPFMLCITKCPGSSFSYLFLASQLHMLIDFVLLGLWNIHVKLFCKYVQPLKALYDAIFILVFLLLLGYYISGIFINSDLDGTF